MVKGKLKDSSNDLEWFVLMKMVSFLLVTVKTVVSRCSNDQLMYYLLCIGVCSAIHSVIVE